MQDDGGAEPAAGKGIHGNVTDRGKETERPKPEDRGQDATPPESPPVLHSTGSLRHKHTLKPDKPGLPLPDQAVWVVHIGTCVPPHRARVFPSFFLGLSASL